MGKRVEQGQRKRRSKSHLASWILFAAAAAVLIAMGVIYYQDRRDNDIDFPPVHTAAAGENEVSNVAAALREQDLDVSYEITPQTARTDELSEVGQGLTIDDAPLYLFIYPDTALREAESVELDPATFDLASTGGTPVSPEPVQIFAGSNVIAALYGGDNETAERVEVAIEELP
ncbi:MAG: hypothetical protein ACRDJH_16195 [Thermomicrobiales bacterium]